MNLIIRGIYQTQEITLLVWRVLRGLFKSPRYFGETIHQMDVLGFGSLAIILLTGTFTGMVLALNSASTLQRFGVQSVTGTLVATSLIRELGPVLTCLMLAGRVGSGIAAELGSMLVSEQIDAMRALGTDPVKKLAPPLALFGHAAFVDLERFAAVEETKWCDELPSGASDVRRRSGSCAADARAFT